MSNFPNRSFCSPSIFHIKSPIRNSKQINCWVESPVENGCMVRCTLKSQRQNKKIWLTFQIADKHYCHPNIFVMEQFCFSYPCHKFLCTNHQYHACYSAVRRANTCKRRELYVPTANIMHVIIKTKTAIVYKPKHPSKLSERTFPRSSWKVSFQHETLYWKSTKVMKKLLLLPWDYFQFFMMWFYAHSL